MTRTRTLAIAGLTAGLLAGGGVGLTLGLPSMAGAQASTTTTVEAPSAPSDRLREALQPLVDAGTITPAQMDAVVGALEAARPAAGDRPGHGGGRHRGKGLALETVAPLLNSTPDEVRDALRAGTSIAAQAEAAGVPLQTIVDALVADLSAKLGTAVDEGRLTQEQADDMVAEAPTRITEQLQQTGRQGDGPARPGRHGGGMRGGRF